jgi:hypothetical protein
VSFFGRLDAAVLVGDIKQEFDEVKVGPGLLLMGGAEQRSAVQAVPVLLFQTGFAYQPPTRDRLRFAGGYQYEYWWMLGQTGGLSRLELGAQGVFLRAEFNY